MIQQNILITVFIYYLFII